MVGKGGYCDGILLVVRSQEVAQGGVKIVVRAASGAVGVVISEGAVNVLGQAPTSHAYRKHVTPKFMLMTDE